MPEINQVKSFLFSKKIREKKNANKKDKEKCISH